MLTIEKPRQRAKTVFTTMMIMAQTDDGHAHLASLLTDLEDETLISKIANPEQTLTQALLWTRSTPLRPRHSPLSHL